MILRFRFVQAVKFVDNMHKLCKSMSVGFTTCELCAELWYENIRWRSSVDGSSTNLANNLNIRSLNVKI